MPVVWRLARAEFADQLDGEGARLFGGRWNSRGRSALYTSAHLSQSVLEIYVNIPAELRDELPVLQAVRISVPDDVATHVSQEQLAGLLARPDPRAACRKTGDSWIDSQAALILAVPSVLIPEEMNLILNPAHPRMRDVAIVSLRRFHFDPRLIMPRA